jgi:hypothetical protein
MPSRLRIDALPAQIMIWCDGTRSLVRRAIDEDSIEKMRDLLYEIDDDLKIMAGEAAAAVANADEEDSENS